MYCIFLYGSNIIIKAVSCLWITSECLLFSSAKLFVPEEEAGGLLAGDGLQLRHTGQLLLVEHGALTTHEAVLISFEVAVGEECWVTDVEDAARVLLVSIVAVWTVKAAERGRDASQQEASTRWKVQRLKDSIDRVAGRVKG